ncbi:uncharacterized protein LOC131644537 isoform X1 [Vicia villosa]|uniref:uncharacterized protein LOC131644537 isoform X1 n=2 Tax=Vicia villosa TaxID=3911 RepID=UPI00273A8791|nr:uncharacterized protein LOC131644537 isoform X1 [Vicia villosa]
MDKIKIKSHRTNSKLHLPQGKDQIHKQRHHQDLSPDSSSSSGGVGDKDSFSFKFGWKSSKQSVGTPIKKLLAEEMSPMTETKRRPPGVIARLMGLDGLPSQHLHKPVPLEKTQSRGLSNEGRSSRRSSRDQEEFKDVFEVSEIPKVESGRHSSSDFKAHEDEMSFIEQKFMNAKRLATYQDYQSSKEFHETLEVLDSNKDLLLKYLKQPDSLFKKHLNDLQGSPFQSHSGHVAPPNMENFDHGLNWRSDKEAQHVNYNRFHQKHSDDYHNQFDKRRVMQNPPRSSKHRFKGSREQSAVATKIVVLKPNLGKLQNGTKIQSSPCSPHNFLSEHGNQVEFSDVRFRDAELYKKINLPDSARSFRHNSLESTEIAKEVTRQMKNSLSRGCMMSSSSRFKGCTRSDSSSSASGNESPEEITAPIGDPFDLSKRSRRSPRSTESSVSREAKKRLSERWKMAHKSQEVQGSSRSSTLADMLAFPGKKGTRFDSMANGGGFYDKFARNGEPSGWVEPLGISSKDGWRDASIGSLSRSKSLPASSTVFGNARTFMCAEALRNDRYMGPKDLKRERRRATMSLDHRHGLNSRSTISGHKKSWSLLSSKQEVNEFSPDLNAVENNIMINLEEDSPNLEVHSPETFGQRLRNTSVVSDDVVDVANGNTDGSFEPSSDKVLPGTSSCVLIKGDSSGVEDNSMQEEVSAGSTGGISVLSEAPAPGLESPCCKDADQPSPISVLDPSFTDDVSSCSECFGSVSADLQGLRMQLQLLKLESEEHVEGPMQISSDEDGVEAYAEMLEENALRRTEDSWESSYIIDVLSESAIDKGQTHNILEVWHSLECPVSLSVFEKLEEERYSDWTICSKSERRMLFDRINSGIVKIHEQSADPQPWVGNAGKTFGSKRFTGLQDGIFQMLGSQGKVEDDALGKLLVVESQWLGLRDDIDVIGREVEILILDDLVAEIVGI